MSTPDVTTPEGRAELCAKARTLAISLEQGNFARLEAAHMIRELCAAIRAEEAARREALEGVAAMARRVAEHHRQSAASVGMGTVGEAVAAGMDGFEMAIRALIKLEE